MQLLEYMKAAKLLEKYEIKSVRSAYVETAQQAADFAGNEAIVLKVISDRALHKSKAGLVKLDLAGEQKIKSAFSELKEKGRKVVPYKIIAQQMATGGIEIIVGGREDEQFGKLILIGLGGIYVETFKDFALRVCPITRYDAEEMVEQLKSKKVITYDGEAREMLVGMLLRVSKLMSENDIKELDLNPVIVRKNGYDVVDIRVLE